ncbi:MAG TPA: carbohydrate kinase family protein [Anaerolineales bacterium]|nr:carbohydrate kinase family protein [Anaerolineales bacterium]HNE69826.1 carbohydrate kinase family protein [Anaerolineales bacterium]HNJ14829.1 carbohydrate kinase family protein [Anaerolineales bacterium]
MKKPIDILVAGEINPDLILTGDVNPEFDQVEKLVTSATLTVGSSSVIFACGAARLGLRVAFIGVCGDDVFGRFMLAEMQKRNVNVDHVIIRTAGQTGLSVILNREADRAILTHPGLIADLQASDIADSLLAQTRHLHVASYFLQTKLQPDLPALFQRAHALGLSTSLDTNYDPSEKWMGFDDLLAITNVFLPNEAEAKSLTGAENVEEAANRLGSKVEALALKLGKDGALGISKSQRVRVESIPAKVVDTVGAGDSFDAGFIYGYLNGWELKKSLQLACVCGALSTQRAGGTEGQPTLQEALAFL